MTSPVHPISNLRAEAENFAAERRWPEAIAAYQAILKVIPEDPDVLLQLSYAHSLAGHYRTAHGFALHAFQVLCRCPLNDDSIAADLISRLRTFNEAEAMISFIASLLPVSRMTIPLLIRAAAQLSYLNLPGRALPLLDEAIRADPEYPVTRMARAQVRMYCGDFPGADQDLVRVLHRAPEIAQAYWLQATLRKQSAQNNHVDAIRRQLAAPAPVRSAGDVALLAFALHKELDDLGDYAGAWNALQQGCRAKRSLLDYQAGQSRELFEALRAMPNVEIGDVAPEDNGPAPIFIVGMHRSGTTLLEQMLDGSPFVHGAGELYDFTSAMRWVTDHHCRGVLDTEIVRRAPRVELREVGRRYLDGARWRLNGEALFTDKLPSNFLNIGFIAAALPQARILHMVRDPVETCFSNLREVFSDANAYSYTQDELADYYRSYRSLMGHWHERFPGRIYDVDYARLVTEPEVVLRNVCDFCGIDFDARMLRIDQRKRGVVTASAVQARSGIASRESPKWLPYERWLQPLINGVSK